MNNIYIFKVDDFTMQDAILAKKFDKTDKVIFMPNETGMINYTLIPIFNTWKTEPTFMQPIADNSDMEPLLFLLGLQCANCNGNLYIVIANNPFKTLDGCEFDTTKGNVSIHVAESLADIMPEKKRRQPQRVEAVVEEYSTESSSTETYDDEQFEDAPEEFVEAIANIQNRTGVDLNNKVNGIYACIKDSKDDLLPTFEFQLSTKFDIDTVEILLGVLQPYINSLREML